MKIIALAEWKDFISTIAVVTTVIQFLAGILVCKQYVNNRTTGESSCVPFLCGILSCTLWLLYGIIRKDDKILLVNSIGVFLELLYVAVYYVYTLKKNSLLRQLFTIIGVILLIIGYTYYETDEGILIQRLGLLACSVSLMFIAAPLTKLFYVMKVRSTECLPFPMIVMAFFVSSLWFMYGTIIEDPYLQVPNLIGFALSSFQMTLFCIYPNTPRSPHLLKGAMVT